MTLALTLFGLVAALAALTITCGWLLVSAGAALASYCGWRWPTPSEIQAAWRRIVVSPKDTPWGEFMSRPTEETTP